MNRPRHLVLIVCLLLSGLAMQPAYADEPTAPSELRTTNYSSRSVEVFWNRSEADTIVLGYELTLNGEILGTFDRLSYFLDGLKTKKEYYFSVTAIDRNGGRSPTSSITFRPVSMSSINSAAADVSKPVTPTGLFEAVYSRSAVEIFWDRVLKPVMTYFIFVDGQLQGKTDGISYFIDGLQGDASYTIDVVASDDQNNRSDMASLRVSTKAAPSNQTTLPAAAQTEQSDALDTQPLADNNVSVSTPAPKLWPDRSVYQQNGYATPNVIRVDLRTATTNGVCVEDDMSGCQLSDVLADTNKNDEMTVDIPVHFSSDDFADDGSVSNATLRQRGGGSRYGSQKSFRIKLDSKKELWRTERFLQLNKHPFESDRMRNKLAMDLMSRVPDLPSFRTQFVNLWIDDGQGAVDYGLFTHVERANDDYLESRRLDKKGNLYKASDFRFDQLDLIDLAVTAEGKPVNKDRFESSLEIEEGKDHRPLLEMLAAVNDPQRSFESVLDEYFNRDNVMAWMAVNLLLMQNDATRHNYILYNPSNTKHFYFLPWDYDATMAKWELPANGSFSDSDLRDRLGYGYALGASNVFVEKFYRLPGIHQELVQLISSLRQSYLDDATITRLSRDNARLIEPFQRRMPDSEHNVQYNANPSFAQNISWNANAVENRLNVPIPPLLLAPERRGDNWNIRWQSAYDPTGSDISYDLQIATGSEFESDQIAFQIDRIENNFNSTVSTQVNAAQLPAGTYYARLIARSAEESDTFWTPARNRLIVDKKWRPGMIRLTTD